jgi:hypothetical protein
VQTAAAGEGQHDERRASVAYLTRI